MKKLIFIVLLVSLVGIFSYRHFLSIPEVKKDKPVAIRVEEMTKKTTPEISLPELVFETPEEAFLDDLTKDIIGLTGESPYIRNKKVWDLRNKALKQADFEAIYAFLKKHPEKEGPNLTLHSLKNDLLVFVIEDGRFKESTAQLMLEIVNDPYQHEVMKEYTLQYFSDYFERNWLTKGHNKKEKTVLTEVDVALQEKMISTLWNALSEKNGPVPGTALIKLHELSKTFSAIESSKVEVAAEKMINDQSMPPSSRMAALSIATERNMIGIAKKAQELALSNEHGISLRLSALHTASKMHPDKEFLEKIKQEFIENEKAPKLLKRAAQLALKNINSGRG